MNELMEDDTAGDPMSNKKWSRKDTRSISKEMKARGIEVSHNTVAKLLKNQDYSLRANRKNIAETHHPDRDLQFKVIAKTKKHFEEEGHPILSLDSKKKELIGNFKNQGRIWGKKSEEVFVHDFRSDAKAIAAPYGLYDFLLNRGTIVVGTSSDTPEFAVDCLEIWLNEFGWNTYPNMKKLLILCDGGGSNGYRPRMWKYGLYTQICQQYDIQISVCHYPAGASKYNPIERRLFSFISMEWAGHPLRSIELMLDYIRGTTTETGLQVNAIFNGKQYLKGRKVPDRDFKQINIEKQTTLPNWNYTISPGSLS